MYALWIKIRLKRSKHGEEDKDHSDCGCDTRYKWEYYVCYKLVAKAIFGLVLLPISAISE